MPLFSKHANILLLSTVILIFTSIPFTHQQEQQPPALDPTEQESLYQVLHSINPSTPWRTLYPDDDNDLCLYPPHGVVCDYFPTSLNDTSLNQTAHIVELNFGYVSEFSPNPPCSQNATLNPLLFTSFTFLRKLFFYNCFNETTSTTTLNASFSIPPPSSFAFSSTLEELVFIQNPSLVSRFGDLIGNFTSLKRLVLIRNGFHGEIPGSIGDLTKLEEVSLSGNRFAGEIPRNLGNLKNLKILDLSHNDFEGCVPESIGENCAEILKLDLGHNRLGGEIPASLGRLKRLQLLDFSYNRFGNFGVPVFLGEVSSLKEVYLSGNLVGGVIPEIWENLGGLLKLGFSGMGLVGEIPNSMGAYLKNLSYLGLDNNGLVGPVPVELGLLGRDVEINLENNNLSGKVPFSIGDRMRFGGNVGLCLDNKFLCGESGFNGSLGQLKPLEETDGGDVLVDGVVFNEGCSLVGHFDPPMLSMLFLLFVFIWF